MNNCPKCNAYLKYKFTIDDLEYHDCSSCDAEVMIKLSKPAEVEEYKVFGISSNTNSFGLREVYCISRGGKVIRFLASQLGMPKKYQVLKAYNGRIGQGECEVTCKPVDITTVDGKRYCENVWKNEVL